MADAESVLTAAIVAGPLLGWLGALVFHGSPSVFGPRHCVLCGSVVALVASLTAAALMALGLWEQPEPVIVLPWLSGTSLAGVDFSISLRLDGLSGALALLLSLVFVLSALSGWAEPRREGSGDSVATLAFLQWAANLVLLTSDLFSLVVAWQLSSVAMWRVGSGGPQRDEAGRNAFLAQWAGGSLLTFAALLAWWVAGVGGTLTLEDLTGRPLVPSPLLQELLGGDPESPDVRRNAATLSVILLCMVVVAAVRCGQFPFFGGMDAAAETRPDLAASAQAAGFVTGSALLLQMSPLLDLLPQAGGLAAGLGAMTAVLAGWIAMADAEPERAAGWCTLAVAGLIFMALGSSGSEAVRPAVLLLATVVATNVALRRCLGPRQAVLEGQSGGDGSPRWLTLAAAIVLGSGLWGQAQALSVLQKHGTGPLMPALLAAGFVGVSLVSAALTRTWLSSPVVADAGGSGRLSRPALLSACALSIGIFGGPLIMMMIPLPDYGTIFPTASINTSIIEPMTVLLVLVASLLGAAGTWLVHVSALSGRLAAGLAPLVRLGRQRFYLVTCRRVLIDVPASGAAQACRLGDWLLTEGMRTWLPRGLARWSGRLSAPLQDAPAQFSLLAFALAAASLAAAVLWL